jgi:hypothetical protein
MGTTTLSAVTRYTAKACAVQGALRDLRRALVHRLREALGSQRQSVDLSRVTRRLEVGGWKVPSAYAEREVVALAADLDLEPVIADTTQRRVRGPRRDAPHFVYDITRLRQRLEALDASKLESVFESDQREETQNDEVVFDTDIVHDRVSVLA